MRATLRASASETRTVPLKCFLTFCDLEVRMWRFLVWPRRIFPVAVFLKRLAAPLWVFNLGMDFLLTNVFKLTRLYGSAAGGASNRVSTRLGSVCVGTTISSQGTSEVKKLKFRVGHLHGLCPGWETVLQTLQGWDEDRVYDC